MTLRFRVVAVVAGGIAVVCMSCSNEEKSRLSAAEARLNLLETRVATAEAHANTAASAAASVAAVASAAGLVGPCPSAKQQCRSAWSSVVLLARKETDDAKADTCRRVQEWGGTHPCDSWGIGAENVDTFTRLRNRQQAWSVFTSGARKASDAASSSASRIQETADAVKPPPDGKFSDAYGAAITASKLAYEACKDTDP